MPQVSEDVANLVCLEDAYKDFDTFKQKFCKMTEDEDDEQQEQAHEQRRKASAAARKLTSIDIDDHEEKEEDEPGQTQKQPTPGADSMLRDYRPAARARRTDLSRLLQPRKTVSQSLYLRKHPTNS